jgi:ribosomal protein S27AE
MKGNGSGIRRKVDRTANPECPSCGANDWMVQEDAEAVALLLKVPGHEGPSGADVLIYTCGNCGFLRMHSIEVLRGNL